MASTIEYSDNLAIEVSGRDYRTNEPCEWQTKADKVSGHYMHVLKHEGSAEICINDAQGDGGHYISQDAAELTALIDVLTSIRDSIA